MANKINLSRKNAPCPQCGTISKRHSIGKRLLRDANISIPTTIEVIYSKHHCTKCRKYFSLPMDHLAQPGGQFTNRARRIAVDLVVKQKMTLKRAAQQMQEKYHVCVPFTTLHDWI